MRAFLGLATAFVAAVIGVACGASDTPTSEVTPVVEAGTDSPSVTAAALCVDGKPAAAYPPEPYEIGITGTLPNLTFQGESGAIKLADYYEPCAAQSRLLVIRTSTLWCGTCQWHGAHTNALVRDASLANRVVLLDLLVADEDNNPATPAALARWRAKLDAPEKLPLCQRDVRHLPPRII